MAFSFSNYGTGATTITANGAVQGTNGSAIYSISSGTDLGITIGSLGSVKGLSNGIYAKNNGSGALTITTNGAVEGTNTAGIFTINSGTNLSVTTDDAASIKGSSNGIYARNNGTGTLTVTAEGDVTATGTATARGIQAKNYGAGGLSITTGADHTVTGAYQGIRALNYSGALTVLNRDANQLARHRGGEPQHKPHRDDRRR
jgi:hypothetical protein